MMKPANNTLCHIDAGPQDCTREISVVPWANRDHDFLRASPPDARSLQGCLPCTLVRAEHILLNPLVALVPHLAAGRPEVAISCVFKDEWRPLHLWRQDILCGAREVPRQKRVAQGPGGSHPLSGIGMEQAPQKLHTLAMEVLGHPRELLQL